MKLRFVVKEKIYDEVEYVIDIGNLLGTDSRDIDDFKDDIEELIYDFEDYGDSDDLAIRLMAEFGTHAVEMIKGGTETLYPGDCCEFQEWIDDED